MKKSLYFAIGALDGLANLKKFKRKAAENGETVPVRRQVVLFCAYSVFWLPCDAFGIVLASLHELGVIDAHKVVDDINVAIDKLEGKEENHEEI